MEKIRLKNVYLALKDQGPFKRFFRNFFVTGNAKGLFYKRSHQNHNGVPKVMYNSKATAEKSARKMAEKHGAYFSNYKCLFCDGYHIGKNQDSVEDLYNKYQQNWLLENPPFGGPYEKMLSKEEFIKNRRNGSN